MNHTENFFRIKPEKNICELSLLIILADLFQQKFDKAFLSLQKP